jgi:hypothetical protein
LIAVAGWSLRNYEEVGVAGLSTIGPINLFYYRAGGTLAYASDTQWFNALHNMEQPHGDLAKAAVAIISRHPAAFAEMTACSLLFVAFAPVHTPLAHLLDIQRSFPIQDPGSMRLRAVLANVVAARRATFAAIYHNELDSSLVMATLTLCQILFIIAMWVGVAAALRSVSLKSYEGRCMIICAAAGLILLLLAAGPEGTARLRIPALPFLAIVAGAGWARVACRMAAHPNLSTPGLLEDSLS